jgi:hypothetical protein
VNIKIHGGVIGNDPGKHGLCTRCQYASIRETNNGEVQITCNQFMRPHNVVLKPLIRCSEFLDHGAVDKYDLEKIAWIVSTDSKTNKVGFTPPKKEEL